MPALTRRLPLLLRRLGRGALCLMLGGVLVAPARASTTDGPVSAAARAEPSVDALCRAAVALALAEPERALSFIGRARAAGWLPEFRFRVFRRFARTEGLTLDDTATTTPVDVSGVDDVRYEWRATWDLSRMVFNPDELQAHAEALRMSDVRRDIQSLVIRLYFERRRLLTLGTREFTRSSARGLKKPDAAGDDGDEMKPEDGSRGLAPPTTGDTPGDERRRIRVLEIEAELEALSGLALSREGVRPAGQTQETEVP